MADTERTWAQLQSLLADNSTQLISAQDLRDAIVSALGGYASLYVAGGSTAQGTLTATPVKLTCFAANGEYRGATPDHTDDSITVGVTGLYLATLTAAFTGTAATTFVLGAAIAGVAATHVRGRAVPGTSTATVACSGILAVTAGQKVSAVVSIVEAPAGQTITVVDASLAIKRIG